MVRIVDEWDLMVRWSEREKTELFKKYDAAMEKLIAMHRDFSPGANERFEAQMKVTKDLYTRLVQDESIFRG